MDSHFSLKDSSSEREEEGDYSSIAFKHLVADYINNRDTLKKGLADPRTDSLVKLSKLFSGFKIFSIKDIILQNPSRFLDLLEKMEDPSLKPLLKDCLKYSHYKDLEFYKFNRNLSYSFILPSNNKAIIQLKRDSDSFIFSISVKTNTDLETIYYKKIPCEEPEIKKSFSKFYKDLLEDILLKNKFTKYGYSSLLIEQKRTVNSYYLLLLDILFSLEAVIVAISIYFYYSYLLTISHNNPASALSTYISNIMKSNQYYLLVSSSSVGPYNKLTIDFTNNFLFHLKRCTSKASNRVADFYFSDVLNLVSSHFKSAKIIENLFKYYGLEDKISF